MPKGDHPMESFAAVLADVAGAERAEAHQALRDPLAPLLDDVGRSVRAQGAAPFRRRDAAAYRSTERARSVTAPTADHLDLRY
jgi:hypothetical protein